MDEQRSEGRSKEVGDLSLNIHIDDAQVKGAIDMLDRLAEAATRAKLATDDLLDTIERLRPQQEADEAPPPKPREYGTL